MLSIDTNILLYAFNSDSPWHDGAHAWLTSIQGDEDVAISEFILAEFYGLLRNPAVLKHPLPADEAVEVIQTYRTIRAGGSSASPSKAARSTTPSGKKPAPKTSPSANSTTPAPPSP